MSYRNVTDIAKEHLGNIDYSFIGKLYKKYTEEYLIRCIKEFPKYKLCLNPKAKAIYLAGICRNGCSKNDIKAESKGFDIDVNSFDL